MGGIKCRNGVLIDYRLVCEKLTIFPYAECTVEFCATVAFYDIVRFKIELWVEAKFICKNAIKQTSPPGRHVLAAAHAMT